MTKFNRTMKIAIKRARCIRRRIHEGRTNVDIIILIEELFYIFFLILVGSFIVLNFPNLKFEIKEPLVHLQIFLENASLGVLLVIEQGMMIICFPVNLTVNLVYGFGTFIVELANGTLVWIIGLWQILKSIIATCFAIFAFLENNIFPFRITGFIILGLWFCVRKLIKENSKNSELLKIAKSNLEKDGAKLKTEKQQLNQLESQNNIMKVEVVELLKKVKELESEKQKLKSQICISVEKVENQHKEFVGEKRELELQVKELGLKLKKMEKQNMVCEEETLTMKSQNHNLNLELEKERDEKLCSVCQDNKKNILLQPCNHFCLCKECLLYKKWAKCPLCRQHIESTIDIYV